MKRAAGLARPAPDHAHTFSLVVRDFAPRLGGFLVPSDLMAVGQVARQFATAVLFDQQFDAKVRSAGAHAGGLSADARTGLARLCKARD